MPAAKLLSPRETGKFVAERSQHVSIDDGGVEVAAAMLAESFLEGQFSMASWKKEHLLPVADEEAINFVLVMDTLNFCFWPDDPEKQFTVQFKGKTYKRYWSMIVALQRALDDGIPITSANYLASITVEQFCKIFRSENEVQIPLIKERIAALNEIGKVLLDKYNGMFANSVRACNKDALKLLDSIVNDFQSFRDVAEFEGHNIAFYKRAQIVIADIWLCFEGKDYGEFHNIHELTMFADYRVPQALEYFGILKYSPELKKVLESNTVLNKGNRYEIEIRGCAIEAVEKLVKAVSSILAEQSIDLSKIAPINAVTVDMYLWVYAKTHTMKMQHLPHHLVRTIFY